MRILRVFKQKNMGVGYAYFYVHFITEVCCFYALNRVAGDRMVLWLVPLIYDFLAFVPQGLIGGFSDKFRKFKPGLTGTVIMLAGLVLLGIVESPFPAVSVIAIGNAFIHVSGAEATLRCSEGKLSHSAVFVAGGSFGVVTGKLLGRFNAPLWLIVVALFTMIPYFIYAGRFEQKDVAEGYDYAKNDIPPVLVMVFATVIVAVRGFMGYGIPTSWNKNIAQMIALYVAMGVGKGMGGILIDSIGMKKTALASIILSVPFLVFGDKLMAVSLFGVCLFSMTMPITLGLLVSVLNDSPGIAFGFTTLGLFLGTLPIFFFKLDNLLINCIMIVCLSIVCVILANVIIKKDKPL